MRHKVELRVAGAQIPVGRDVGANASAIRRAIDYAAREKVDVLVTPEGSLSGYTPDFDARATADALDEMVRRAREAKVALRLGSCFEDGDGGRYDAQRFYDKDGAFLGFHAKILLCRRMAASTDKEEIQFLPVPAASHVFTRGPYRGRPGVQRHVGEPEWTPVDDPHLSPEAGGTGGARSLPLGECRAFGGGGARAQSLVPRCEPPDARALREALDSRGGRRGSCRPPVQQRP